MNRKDVLRYLAKIILGEKKDHPLRVGIDGVDASGKTFLADELAEELESSGREIIRISIDGFHNLKEMRYKKGRNSPEGYYFDSFNNRAIINKVLLPLGPEGNLKYRKKIFDFKIDSRINSSLESANKNAILLMDGVFLFRPELVEYWDLKIFLDVDFEITVKRASKRDGYYLGSEQEIIKKYNTRYVPGQKLYFGEANPKDVADIIINNSDFTKPIITKDAVK